MFQTDFSIGEFRSRRKRVCQSIGHATALIAGAPAANGSFAFRQYNDFYYLCGVEVPHAYLAFDGATGTTTLFLPEAKHLIQDSDDRLLCADDPEYAREMTGVDRVAGRDQLEPYLAGVSRLYTFLRDGEGPRACVRSLEGARQSIEADPWDGQPSRGAHLCAKLKTRFPKLVIEDLAPIIYEMRMLKSPRELDLLRRAGQLSALGLREAMRATRPGVMEYQLAALLHYHYLAGGAWDASYPPIVGGGKNAFHGHYHSNTSPLRDGDMVLVDCAPDYQYYTSDITRMWPVNGKYTPAQRALYGFVTEYHKTLLAAIRPGRTCTEIEDESVDIMRSRLKEFDFATRSHATGPQWMFNFRSHLAHSVGLSVHDGLSHKDVPLRPGMVFAVDPQMKIEADRLYLRVEDTIVVTEQGCEALTGDIPLELDEIEAVMQGASLLEAFPPLPPPPSQASRSG
jgi:Xaa-Pro aminopeptidase